ncbi:MAG: HepT-like ribonuclease domain-containing protein [Nocardioidaceae bacterium]
MSRRDHDRLVDILEAAAAISNHLERGSLEDGLVFDAVRVRLIEIGEAVKAIEPDLLSSEPGIPWRDVAGMRDYLAHHYFDTLQAIVATTVTDDLPALVAAVRRLRGTAESSP